jgi:hypothetical protein
MHYALYFANVVSPLRFSYQNTIFRHTAVIKKKPTHFKLVSPVQRLQIKISSSQNQDNTILGRL